MTKGEIAYDYFKQGYNCSQAVALAFADELGLSKEQVARLSVGFGGGFGRQRLVCGAVSGMTMVIGHVKGATCDKLGVYEFIQKACAEFKENAGGSLICAELLAEEDAKKTSPQPDARTEEYYKKRPCAEICQIAADITAKYLD